MCKIYIGARYVDSRGRQVRIIATPKLIHDMETILIVYENVSHTEHRHEYAMRIDDFKEIYTYVGA